MFDGDMKWWCGVSSAFLSDVWPSKATYYWYLWILGSMRVCHVGFVLGVSWGFNVCMSHGRWTSFIWVRNMAGLRAPSSRRIEQIRGYTFFRRLHSAMLSCLNTFVAANSRRPSPLHWENNWYRDRPSFFIWFPKNSLLNWAALHFCFQRNLLLANLSRVWLGATWYDSWSG